ncbi:ribonuclease Z [Candidatus Woesearchaeota archaeon]|nr:ribonuclease Z [Candidatus Woesearchaeota archaeon]
MEIIFLGTSGMQPTKQRNQPSIYLSYGSTKLLIDCGEGTQRQMNIAGLKPTKLSKILITHFHGDHVLGLGGLIRNLGANEFKGTLEIFGPHGLNDYYKNIMHSCVFNEKINVKLKELKQGIVYKDNEFVVYTKRLDHTSASYGFRFEEKPKRKINLEFLKKIGLIKDPLLGGLQRGNDIIWQGKKIYVKDATYLLKSKIITVISDTRFCKNTIELSKDADLLICECTFLDEEKKAREYMHLSAKDVAKIGNEARVKKIIVTHFSQRYKNTGLIKKEISSNFKGDVVCADDFLKIKM